MKSVEYYENKYQTIKRDLHNFSYHTIQKEKLYSFLKKSGQIMYKYIYILLPLCFVLLFFIIKPSFLVTEKKQLRWVWCVLFSLLLTFIVVFTLYKMNWWSFSK